MACDRLADEGLQAGKVDVLYGEADAKTRASVQAHLAGCASCRDEMEGLARLRDALRSWQQPGGRRLAELRRTVILPRWLAVAAALLLGVGLGLGASGYLALYRALAAQAARADALEQRQLETSRALHEALAVTGTSHLEDASLLDRLDARVTSRILASEARQRERLDLRFAEWTSRTDAQRRVDLARVAEGLSYLDGRNAQQLARTNEMMGYVLASQRR